MMIRLGVVLCVVVPLLFATVYLGCYGWYIFLIVAVTHVLSRIITFTLTGFTAQSLYYPQIIHIATITITAAIIHCRVCFFFFFFFEWIVGFVTRTKKEDLNGNKAHGLN
jgi:hypothetical protein